MLDLIARTSLLIGDTANTQFTQQQVQDYLDANRDDIRYEPLTIGPSIVNLPSTNNMASTIFADYYSKYSWWEQDVILQGYYGGQAWVVLTPVVSEYLVGHWSFEANVFTAGTVPGQLPPVFATGKIYDIYASAADLLEFWSAIYTASYDVTVDGQSLRRSQLMLNKLELAAKYRQRAKPKLARMSRGDVLAPISSRRMRLLDDGDNVKGY